MRSAQKSNRARGRGNRKSNGNNVNRVYDSSGPEGKVRGTPQQIIDKYLSLARDAQTSGDRVMAENFLQHAEHYQRILLLATASQADRRDQSSDAEDDAPGTGDQPMVEERPRPRANGTSDAEPTEPERAEAEEVSGLTTIDPDESDAEDALVPVAEEPAPSPPPARRRRRAPKAEPAAEATEPSGEGA